MPEEGKLLAIVIQAFSALGSFSGVLDAFQDFSHVIFDVVFDDIDFDDVLSQVVVLDICDLSVFVAFLHEITEMVGLHLFDYLDQPVVECSSNVGLMGVLLLQTTESLYILAVLVDNCVAQLQGINYLMVNGLVFVFR